MKLECFRQLNFSLNFTIKFSNYLVRGCVVELFCISAITEVQKQPKKI